MGEIQTKICPECHKEFTYERKGRERKFCNCLCNARYNSRLRYHNRNKLNPVYKENRKKYMEAWLVNNREKHNNQMRKYALGQYYKKREAMGKIVKPRKKSEVINGSQ